MAAIFLNVAVRFIIDRHSDRNSAAGGVAHTQNEFIFPADILVEKPALLLQALQKSTSPPAAFSQIKEAARYLFERSENLFGLDSVGIKPPHAPSFPGTHRRACLNLWMQNHPGD